MHVANKPTVVSSFSVVGDEDQTFQPLESQGRDCRSLVISNGAVIGGTTGAPGPQSDDRYGSKLPHVDVVDGQAEIGSSAISRGTETLRAPQASLSAR